MAKNHQLLLTARDYFQFVTNFFEVIDISVSHLYHSALELSPLTSIIRKLYYHQRPSPSPRVVFGNKDSWNLSAATSGKDSDYLSTAWSPCGQFVAATVGEVVEIWDALTLKPLSTLQITKAVVGYKPGLAYSPDGHSLAGCSDSAIIIWDTQTGGEAIRVECEITHSGLKLVWSKDGGTIAAISPLRSGTITVCTYSITSGAKLFLGTLRSSDKPHIWPHNETFRIIAMTQDEKGKTFNIFEVGSTMTQIESFSSKFNFNIYAFSPATYRAFTYCSGSSLSTNKIHIIDLQSSEILLKEECFDSYGAFSPDASFFAALSRPRHYLSIWRYSSGHYVQWREFQQPLSSLQFSSTSLSILSTHYNAIHVVHLDYLPTAVTVEHIKTTQGKIRDAFSPDGTCIVTALEGESTITIANLHPQNPFPSQHIDTELEISKMVLTGNVLIVKSPDKIVAWLLTEEGAVDGIIGNTRADHNDSIWELSLPTIVARLRRIWQHWSVDNIILGFTVVDEIAIVKLNHLNIYAYHIRTGEVVEPTNIPQSNNHTFYHFHNKMGNDECDLYHSNLYMQQGTVRGKQSILQVTLQEGWVKDLNGKHRMWLPPSWRTIKGNAYWFHDTTTLRLKDDHQYAVVKF